MTREEERQKLLNKQVETLRLHGISVEEVMFTYTDGEEDNEK